MGSTDLQYYRALWNLTGMLTKPPPLNRKHVHIVELLTPTTNTQYTTQYTIHNTRIHSRGIDR